MASYRGSIVTEARTQRRYLRIEEVNVGQAQIIAKIGLAGRGTWREINGHLAEHGYRAKQWKQLSGCGELRTMLIPN